MPNISVVIPVLNEKYNVFPILSKLDSISNGCNLEEVIFVDGQSTDGTLDEINRVSSGHRFIVRTIIQKEKDGLVAGEVLGAREASAEYVVMLDGDMQHPPELIRDMLENSEGADIIVASRYTKGGTAERLPLRGIISRIAVTLAHILIPASRKILDPTSGFFMARKYLFDNLEFIKMGYETLLFILAWHPEAIAKEVPYAFIERRSGKSKIVDRTGRFILNFIKQSIYCRKVSTKSIYYEKEVQTQETIR